MKRTLKTTLALALVPSLLSLTPLAYAEDAPAASTTTPAATQAPAKPKIPVSANEQAKIEQVVHDYLMRQPEVMVEALQVLQRKQSEQAQKVMKETQQNAPKFANALFHDASDPAIGNANSKITVVEFFDYQCPHCVDMAGTIDKIIKANKDTVRFIFKDFPIRGALSEMAARAAIAANLQGKYFKFHNDLLTVGQPLTEDIIIQTAKKAGLNIDQMKIDMNSSTTTEKLKANVKLAQDLKLFGTPAFFVGRTAITDATGGEITYAPGQMSQSQLQSIIDKASN